MNPRLKQLLVPVLVATAAAASSYTWAQQAPAPAAAPKPEQLIKWRQSAYQVIAWNGSRIKASVDGTYNKEDVIKAANSLAAVANSGLGSLFVAGTETGKGWRDTNAKPALFTDARVAELSGNFVKEANELAKVAQTGDQAAVKEQQAKLNRTCKACHDDYRVQTN